MQFMFCFIFTIGYRNRGVGEGIRYGIYMGLFFAVMQAFDPWVIYPLPLGLALNWFLSSMAMFIVMGIILALIYKPKTA